MKAFEKWFSDYVEEIPDKWNRLLAIHMKKLYEFIWRAALEWVMEKGMDNYGNDFLSFDLSKNIREELGE